ncbi:MAG: RNA 2',3'-cyclic phosphodiesterase [Candidatus Omnitrophica bacterium]|nr:RNA 2',3'-cyclic phosphodiesterase [Candidatus Omnitrophota bacterium]
MRAFIAIELAPTIKDTLAKIQDGLKPCLPKVSWVKPRNLHLTLKFLGDISPHQLKEIKRIIAEAGQETPAFKVKLDDLGVFPGLRQARIIWAGISQDTAVKQLAEILEAKISGIGIPKEKREFSSHITIARVRNPIDPADLETELKKGKNDLVGANLEFNAGGITLFESVLGTTQGPVYTVLEKANFNIT